MIKIEKGFAIPIKKAKGKGSKYPFREMEIGDSFAVAPINAQAMRTAMQAICKETGHKFTTRTNETECRCWRIS